MVVLVLVDVVVSDTPLQEDAMLDSIAVCGFMLVSIRLLGSLGLGVLRNFFSDSTGDVVVDDENTPVIMLDNFFLSCKPDGVPSGNGIRLGRGELAGMPSSL